MGRNEKQPEGPPTPHVLVTPIDTTLQHDLLYQQVVPVDRWGDRSCAALSCDGYKSLSVLAIFMAGVQSSILTTTIKETSLSYQVINACFIGGLLSDVLAAMMSLSSARWFDMLTREEDDYFHNCWVDVENGQRPTKPMDKLSLIEKWVALSILATPYAMGLGLGLFVVGLMTFVFTHQSSIVKAIAAAVCVFAITLPPFAFKHSRRNVLSMVVLKRRSG